MTVWIRNFMYQPQGSLRITQGLISLLRESLLTPVSTGAVSYRAEGREGILGPATFLTVNTTGETPVSQFATGC